MACSARLPPARTSGAAVLLALVSLLALNGCTVVSRTSEPVPIDVRRTRTDPPDLVVLVHGMGRTPVSMMRLERHLARDGYRVLNFGYSSVGPRLPALGRSLVEATDAALAEVPSRRVHFVGHSLGGIVVRWLLANRRPAGTGRVVLLAPLNEGAASADRLAPLVGWLLPPIRDLQTADGSAVRRLPAHPGVPVLVVAGRADGKVSLAETRLDGADASVVVPSGHTFVMMRPSVMRLVSRYLADEVPADAARPNATPARHPERGPAQATVTSPLR